MQFQFYDQLPIEAKAIRESVFMKEQGFKNEFDDIDSVSLHLVVFDDEPIACARMFSQGHRMILGRIAVVKEKRGQHIGNQILNVLELKAKELGFQEVALSAQVNASQFYEKNGYQKEGKEYLDEHCPHIYMKKVL